MINFRFENTTKILFGKGTQSQVGEYTSNYSRNILLHFGGDNIKKSGLYDEVIASLKKADINYIELGGVKPNPRISLVKEGIEICKRNNINFILAVGGGSVIDSAKAIAAGMDYEGDLWDLYSNNGDIKNASVGIGVLLTIAASGSETSSTSVIKNDIGELMYKRSFSSNLIRPKFAIMNPELTMTLTKQQKACGGVDIIAHVLERYFTNEKNVELTDRLCEATLKTVINNLSIAIEKPNDYNSMAEIMWASTIAHNNLLSTGRRSDWGSHAIEQELNAIYDIHHGTGLSIIIPAWMKYVYKHDINRFVQYANRVWNIDIDWNDLDDTALKGIKKTEEYFKMLGQPVRLSELNINEEKFIEMSERAVEHGEVGDFVKLCGNDVYNIYKLAL